MKTIEEIETADLSKEQLEAEKHARDAQVQTIRAEMRRIRQKLEPHYVAANKTGMSSRTTILVPKDK